MNCTSSLLKNAPGEGTGPTGFNGSSETPFRPRALTLRLGVFQQADRAQFATCR
jgi:hypothetical protein